MGNSTISLQNCYDVIAAQGVFDPRQAASGYGDNLALTLANDAMADLVCERFNHKWNSQVGTAFYTNAFQQDYPQLAQPGGPIGWGERCDVVDINNQTVPKPVWQLTWRRQLNRAGWLGSTWIATQICWMYNSDLTLGTWPGAHVTYYPLLGVNAPAGQNPIMNFLDANGNILIVTGFGTTGTTAPAAAEGAAEGTTVTDGTVTWTVVSPTSQGFRLDSLGSGAGPVYQITPIYQLDPPLFTAQTQLINPVPNSYARHFRRLLKAACNMSDKDPEKKKEGQNDRIAALAALAEAMKQGDRELNLFGVVPAQPVVQQRWGFGRPRTACDPY